MTDTEQMIQTNIHTFRKQTLRKRAILGYEIQWFAKNKYSRARFVYYSFCFDLTDLLPVLVIFSFEKCISYSFSKF